MAERIIIEAQDVWGYFEDNKEKLATSMEMIASNIDYGTEIYLSEEEDYPMLIAMVDDDVDCEELILNERDCYETVTRFYENYISSGAFNALVGEETSVLSTSEEMDLIEERELKIDDAVYSLMNVLVPNLFDINDDPDEIYEDLKDHICEYLYKQYGFSVYRPMYLECEDGTDEFCEFPYEEMEFEDE